jgi:hypothetical protein
MEWTATGFQGGELAAEFLKSAVLAAIVRANDPEVDRLVGHRGNLRGSASSSKKPGRSEGLRLPVCRAADNKLFSGPATFGRTMR